MPRWSSHRWSTGWIALLLLACKPAPAAPEPALTHEQTPVASVHVAVETARPVSHSGVDPRLPVVGDPLGLLSKPPAPSAKTGGRAQATKLDPAALLAGPGARPTSTPSPEATPARERNYAGVLEGALDAFWIRSDGTTRAELKSAGIKLPNDVFSIPLFAVFAGQRRLVAKGNSRELSQLPATLDELP